MRTALIGGAGFVGHHLAPLLRHHRHDVLIVDALGINNFGPLLEKRDDPWGQRYLDMVEERFRLVAAAGVHYRHCDARDYHRLSRVLAEWQPDAIVHLAAVAHITVTRLDQHLAWEHSILTLKNSLDVAAALAIKHFVYLSSSTVYGNFRWPVLDEDDPIEPDTTYGAFKAIGEAMVKSWNRDKALPYTIVRPQALYGPRCVSRRVTQVFIERALDGLPILIEGDGSSEHDFTFISDLIAGIVAVLDRPMASLGQTFCVTAGEARSLTQLAAIVNNLIPCKIEYVPADPQKPSRGTMSTSKAEAALDWRPRVKLEDGIARCVAFYKDFLAREKHHAA